LLLAIHDDWPVSLDIPSTVLIHKMRRNQITFRPSATGSGVLLEAAQFFAERRERIFEVFSDAFQLETLTPPWLQFAVLTPRPIHIREGTRIDYRMRLHGVPVRWQSRIDVWEPPLRFVDEQTRGPYRRWRHEHVFEEVTGGTIYRDRVDYAAPGGWLIERLFVRKSLLKIFEFRQRMLNQVFPGADEAPLAHVRH
jgi:ligand-binding SRPBCC domain-containing protein